MIDKNTLKLMENVSIMRDIARVSFLGAQSAYTGKFRLFPPRFYRVTSTISTIARYFSIYVFLPQSRKKIKYRWFKVEGFVSGGGVVGWWWRSCPVSQRVTPVTLRKTLRNHVNAAAEASSAAKLFVSAFSWFNNCNCAWLLNTTAQLFRRNSFRYIEIRSDQAKLSSKGCINDRRLHTYMRHKCTDHRPPSNFKHRWKSLAQFMFNCFGPLKPTRGVNQ